MLYLANATPYGLGASLWTQDTLPMHTELVGRLNAGNVFFNGIVNGILAYLSEETESRALAAELVRRKRSGLCERQKRLGGIGDTVLV